ncbi:MAG: protease modulator HflC [Desulfomonile sp.]|nr:protease modulator HflC [Desulfomonile sp.]
MVKAIVIFGAVLFLLSQTAFVIYEGEQGFVLQFGVLIKKAPEPGLYFKVPFIQDVHIFEKRIMAAEVRPEEYITLDKKRLTVDIVSRWQITDPVTFYRTVRDPLGAKYRLNDIITGRLRRQVASHNFNEFIQAKREEIMEQVTKETRDAAKDFGLNVVDVRIKRLDLPNEVQASVFARMKAERERIAKRYRAEGEEQARAIRADADKQQKIILADAYRTAEALRGEGDAEAAAIYAEAYGKNEEFYSFVRHLDVYRKVLGSGTTLLLRSDSRLMQFLDSPSGRPAPPQAAPK